jgi:hypothetical protein
MNASFRIRAAFIVLISLPAAAQLAPTFTGKNVPLLDPATKNARFMLAADVNSDGVMDLVALVDAPTAAQPAVSVLLGRASGGYEAPVTSPLAGTSLQDLAIGDLDGDAFPDLASVTINQRMVTAKGVGDGSFVQSYEYFAGNGVLSGVAIADLNGDAIGDVLSATNTATGIFGVNFGLPGGGYLATQSWSTGHVITSLDLADLDGNGQPDLVACNSAQNKLSVTLGDGAGGFLASQLKTTVATALQVLAAPLDGDADTDVLVVASGGSGATPGLLQPWLGDGAGGLQPAATSTTGLSALRASLADVDGDGDLDAAVFCNGDATITLMLNDGAAHFSTADSLPIGTDVSRVELVDASGDGVLDVVAQVQGSTATVLRADAPADVPTGDAWFNGAMKPRAIDVALVDGDSLPDVVVATDNPALATLRGEPGGMQTTPVVSTGYLMATDLAAGDLDGDALSDVVVAPDFGFVFTPYLQVGHGLGTGAFDVPQSLSWTSTDAAAHQVQLLDLDGDGWRDIAALVTAKPASVVSFRNAGSGALAFDAAQTQAVGNDVRFLAAGDLDGDGKDDVVLAEPAGSLQASAGLYALLGDGSGVLQPGPFTDLPAVSYQPSGLALGDMDLDGQLDAVVGDETEGRIAVAYGNGAGGLLAAGWEPAKLSSNVIHVADLDGDGWPDVAHSPYTNDPAIVVRFGDGAGGLLAPVTVPCADKVVDFVLADLTQDNQPDLVVACSGTALRPSRVQLQPNVAAPFTWKDLGSALAGGTGDPRLVGTGELATGTPGFVRLTNAKASSPSVLFLSATSTPVAFKGGTIVAFPPLLLLGLPTGANGTIDLAWSAWPSNLPGASWLFQFAVQDAGAVHGVALSNAISGTEP